MMVVLFDVATLVLSTIMAIRTAKKVGTSTRYIIYFFFFVIMVIPIFLDYFVGKPVYTSWLTGSKNYGFIVSYDDAVTRVLYDIYVLLFQRILLHHKKSKDEFIAASIKNQSAHEISPRTKKGIYFLMVLLAILPAILVCICPLNKSILFQWGWRDLKLYGVEESKYYFSIEKLSYIGEISSLLLLLTRPDEFNVGNGSRKSILEKLCKPIWLILVYVNICIESKRSILIFVFAIIITYLIDVVPRKKMMRVFAAAGIAIGLIVGLSIFVKTQYRSYTATDAIYTTLRIDYFRDDTTKMLIYSLFHLDEIKVLEFPFQSYLMQIGFIFPLDHLGLPRLGYNTYFTCALLGQPLSSGLNYTTISMYDEMIANFGLLGFITAPLFSVWYARLADKQSTVLKTIMISGYVLLVMYSLNYIMWYLEVLCILLFLSKYTIRVGERYLFR